MSQRVSKVGNIKYALSGDDKFVASVDSGETFVVECAINVNDGTIRHLGQQLTQADVTMPFVNGATGPIESRLVLDTLPQSAGRAIAQRRFRWQQTSKKCWKLRTPQCRR